MEHLWETDLKLNNQIKIRKDWIKKKEKERKLIYKGKIVAVLSKL